MRSSLALRLHGLAPHWSATGRAAHGEPIPAKTSFLLAVLPWSAAVMFGVVRFAAALPDVLYARTRPVAALNLDGSLPQTL